MNIPNLLKIAIRSLGKNRMRSFLTMLGIIIGVGSVIALLAIGEGSSQSIKSNIQKLGTNMITVMPAASKDGGIRMAAGSASSLSAKDAAAMASFIQGLSHVSPVANTQVQVISGNKNWRSSIYGSWPDYFHIRNLELEEGRLFTKEDERQLKKVCLLGATVVEELFGEGAEVVGRQIRINNVPFVVIGILAEKGQSGFGQDQVQSGAEDDFSIRTMSEITSTMGSITSALTLLLAAIASISLLVYSWRNFGCFIRYGRSFASRKFPELANRFLPAARHCLFRFFLCYRYFLWLVPCQESSKTRSHFSPEI